MSNHIGGIGKTGKGEPTHHQACRSNTREERVGIYRARLRRQLGASVVRTEDVIA